MSKKDTRRYADELRGSPPPADKLEMPEELAEPAEPDDVDVASPELGLTIFDAQGSGDIQPFDQERFRARLKSGHTMLERFLSLVPGQEAECWLLGWSATLIPDIRDKSRARYIRKLHLELRSGARVSLLEAAQLAGVFVLPMDGSVEVVIVKGHTEERKGRQVGNWGVSHAINKRKPTHEAGKSYAQVASEALLVAQLQAMSVEDLMRVDAAPPGLLDPYIAAARRRELDAEMAKRQAEANRQ